MTSWQRVYERLSEFVQVAGAAGDAIAEGDAPRARALVHETRAIRAALIRAKSYAGDAPIPETPAGIELLTKMQVAREQSMVADRIARAWIERELPDDETLVRIEGGHLAMADRLLPATWDVDIDVVAIIGPGGEKLAHALVQFGQRRIVVYAPSDRDKPDSAALYPSEALVISERDQLNQMMEYSKRPPERLICHAIGQPDDLVRLTREVEESFGALIVGRNTVAEFGELWLEQGLANLARIASVPSIAHFGDRFFNVPMVIVAPGPSLNKNVHLLAELQGKAIIATFSHTLAALKAAGVQPNLVLAVDMQDLRYHFDGFPVEEIDALALGLTVHPDLYSIPAKMTLAFASNSQLDDWICEPLREDLRLSSGGSVAHSAFSLARRWRCNPVILVGQDLSFSDGRVYCDGNVDDETVAEISDDGDSLVLKGWSDGYANLEKIGGRREGDAQPLIRVPGHAGGEVPTSAAFALFRRWFIDAASLAKRSSVELQLMNCTEGGAHIDGWNHISLRDAIDGLGSRDDLDIPKLFAAPTDVDHDARRQRIVDRLRVVDTAVGSSLHLSKKCIRLVDHLGRGRKSTAGKLAAAEKRLVKALKPISFIALAAQQEINRGNNAARDERALDENLRASRRLLCSVRDVCLRFGPKFTSALQQLESSDGEQR